MKFKDVVTSEASTEAKVAALALLLDKELIKLADTVLNVKKLEGPKGEQGIQGPKGEQGDRGFDGTNGKDGADGKDGKDGEDGKQGVGVADAKIDFDGSLVITLTDGTEINAGDVVPLDTAEKIRVIGNGGGTSQSVLDAIDAINAVIATYGTMALQDDTAVDINGGSIDGTAIGAAVPAAATFTTLTATGQTSLGGAAGSEAWRFAPVASSVNRFYSYGSTTGNTPTVEVQGLDANINQFYVAKGSGRFTFWTNGGGAVVEQFRIAHTASAVNYVQVTGAATSSDPTISAQGSDASINFTYLTKGSAGEHRFSTNTGGNIQFKVTHTASAANYLAASGSVTGSAPTLKSTGSDTNISQVFQSKGTGAIDLAAGSRGVNISNGGTVTALTRTGVGSGYTSSPTVVISAPTTAGGVQATATVPIVGYSPTVSAGGTGYTVNDVLTISGGTFSSLAMQVTVSAVSGGVITAVTLSRQTDYTVAPSNPVSVTGGTGSGATFNITWGISTPISITNAGSGYVEQPTVSFSGGGGSGAAAYATVGSGVTVKSIGSTMSFQTPGGVQFKVNDTFNGGTSANWWSASGRTTGSAPFFGIAGETNTSGIFFAKGNGALRYNTGATDDFGGNGVEQLRVSHTASAVNYVQVTGAATTAYPTISAQGSDTNPSIVVKSKGSGSILLRNGGDKTAFVAYASASGANYIGVDGTASGTAPFISAQGSDTNIDLALTPKGTGNVRFGTLTASADAPITGYITIKDSGGTVRKLAVIA